MQGLPEQERIELPFNFSMESPQQLQCWLEHLPVAAYACDAEGLITYFNSNAATLWGREPKLNDPADRYCGSFGLYSLEGTPISHDACWMALALKNRSPYSSQEVLIERADGSRIQVLANINPILSEGQLLGAVNLLIDLSERKRIETALQNVESRYSELVNNLDGIVWEVDVRTMRFRFVSEQAERILGYPLHRWLDEPTFWQDHIHPEDREFAINYCLNETRRGKGHKFEYRMLAADGRVVWLHDFVSVECEGGEPVTLRGVMVDITDRKDVEQKLRESEEKFATFFRKLPVPLSITEIEDGTFVDLNDEVLRISGYSKQEVLGRTSRELGWITNEERSGIKQTLIEQGRFDNVEISLLTKAQERLQGIMSARIVKIGGRNRLIATMQDVTARKIAESKLRESEEKFAKVFRDAPILFAITEFETGLMVDFNDEALRVSGFNREDVVGKSSLEIGWISPVERERMKQAIAHEGRFENLEVEFHGKGGRRIIGLVSGEQIVIDGRLCLLTAMVDITLRKQAKELMAFQNRVLEMLATGFSLTDILTEITRSVEMMEPDMRASILLYDPEEQRLRHGAAPSLPLEYLQLIDGVKVGEKVGSCGTAVWRRTPVIAEDVEKDPLWADYRELGRAFGFRACWSSPILDHDAGVLGTFALYYSQPGRPTSDQEHLINQATHLAAIAIHNRRREQALFERQAQLVASQRISKVGSWELDLTQTRDINHNRLRWTDEVYRIMGYNPDQVSASNEIFWARVHPEDRPRIEASIQNAIETQSIYEIEHRVVLDDGTERIVHERGEIVPDLATRKPLKFIGTIQDITERKLAKEAITTYLEYLTVAVAWTDDQNRVEYVNRKITELFGYERNDVPDMDTWFRLAYPDPEYRARVIETWVPSLEKARKVGGTIGPIEVNVTCKDGSKRFVSASGRIVGTRQIVTFNDLTERKMAENALITSEARSRAVLEALPDLMFLMNSEGLILDYHAADEKELYVSPDVFLGRCMDDLLPPPVAALFRENRDRVHKTRQQQLFEYELEIPGQGKHSFEARMTLSGDLETITIVRNITERLKLEEKLRQSQKMEAVGRLAGGIAHDFNNLLTVITGYTSLVMSSLPGNGSHHEALKQVMDAGQSAADLINRLLAFSRQQVLQPRDLDLNDIVRSFEIMLRRLIGRNITITSNLGVLTHHIKADPVQIEQVLINLAINARDAMPHGGTLRIQTQEVEISEAEADAGASLRPGKFAMLSVSDTGHGIPPEILHQIFEPFFTTKEPGKGTGLGLATVHGIVMQSGGSITVESKPASGTTFKVYFRAFDRGTVDRHSGLPGKPAPSGKGRTLLVVEDDSALRAFVSQVLTSRGYHVLEAANGQKAMELIETLTAKVDLLITDQMMPEMTGRELMDRIQSSYPELKFLLMSGYSDDTAIRESIERDFVSFLAKPFTPPDLIAKVQELIPSSHA